MELNNSFILPSSVYHKRHFPKVNEFSYRLFYLLIARSDIRQRKRGGLNMGLLCAANRPALLSYYDKDHGLRDGTSAFSWAQAVFAEHDIALSEDHIYLLTLPRILGYVFNPVSFWFAFDEERKKIRGVLCEVNNTFGESHTYVCLPKCDDQTRQETIEKEEWIYAKKLFHVSPFIERNGFYAFRFQMPSPSLNERILIAINYFNRENKLELSTSMSCGFETFSRRNLIFSWLRSPLLTLQVLLLIHYQAIKLIAKKIVYRNKPCQVLPRVSSSNPKPDFQKCELEK